MTKGHFTVVYLVAKPLIWSEAEVACYDKDQYLVSMITKKFTFEKQNVCITTRSTLASLLFKGLAT